MWSRVVILMIPVVVQNPLGGGPSGQIGGFGEGVSSFLRLVRTHPAEVLVLAGLLLLFLWLIRRSGTN